MWDGKKNTIYFFFSKVGEDEFWRNRMISYVMSYVFSINAVKVQARLYPRMGDSGLKAIKRMV